MKYSLFFLSLTGFLFACGPTTKITPKPNKKASPLKKEVKKQPTVTKTEPVKKKSEPPPKVLNAQKTNKALASAAIDSIQDNKIDDYRKLMGSMKEIKYYCPKMLEQQNPDYLERRFKDVDKGLGKQFGSCTGQDWANARLIKSTGMDVSNYASCDQKRKHYNILYTYRIGEGQNLNVSFTVYQYLNPNKSIIASSPYCTLYDAR